MQDSTSIPDFLWPKIKQVADFLTAITPMRLLPPVDAIFVFGHYDPTIAIHAAELWRMKKAPRIVLTGKGRDAIPEGFPGEAEYYASILRKEGIPEEGLILENASTNSLENVQFGMQECRARGFYPKSLILVSMPPLLRRSLATFQKQFPEILTFGSSFVLPKAWYTVQRLPRLLAELDRLAGYAKAGDIADVAIPDDVLTAAKEIRGHIG